MILKATLDAELDRLDGVIAAANRARFAALARCDFQAAHLAWADVKRLRRERVALINGDLFANDEK